ncbi:MAG: GDSL-type esterase/lipase family protein [Clostridiales bacterium]|nr:GDSL-type esterase/lipase family protein [Clostridiales bacterium]
MFIPIDRAGSVRFTGRWFAENGTATATAPGSYFELGFSGTWARLIFDIRGSVVPYPHLWISVDGGPSVESPVDRYLRIGVPDGEHRVTVIFKSANETHARWFAPLVGKVSFSGFEADAPAVLPEDTRDLIEFVGDSITEGILIDPDQHYDDAAPSVDDRALQDDSTASYAWLTAQALGMRPVIMGYGAVGCTHAGSGAVVRAPEAYPFCYDGAPISRVPRRLIVINHGANDVHVREQYPAAYAELLDVVRGMNPGTPVVALSPFTGYLDRELSELIPAYNKSRGADVRLILTGGWIDPEPLHPLRDGHRIVAEHLTEELKKLL